MADRVAAPAARIYDVRYQRYRGQSRSRVSAVGAFARSGWLRAPGIRRAATAKIWPFLLIAVCYLPVIVVVALPAFARGLLGNKAPTDVLTYDRYLANTSLVVLVFVASTIPNMLAKDRRDRVLSLYFSTSLSRPEYVVGRAASALGLASLVTLGPVLLLFLGSVLVDRHPVSYFTHHVGVLPRAVLAALLVATFHAVLALAVGALTARRVFAVGAFVALELVSSVLAGIIFGVTQQAAFLVLSLAGLPYILSARVMDESVPFASWIGLAGYAVVMVACAVVVAIRYARKKGTE